MNAGLTGRRLRQLLSVGGAQTVVQVVGFIAGIVLVRHMEPVDYGYMTLALSLLGAANVLTDLGLSAAVMSSGGRLVTRGLPLRSLTTDAADLHRRIAVWVLPLLAPCSAWMLWRLGAPAWQVGALTLLLTATTLFSVRSALALAALRVLGGHISYQQGLDLALNVTRLVLFMLAAWAALSAPSALAVVLLLSIAQWMLLSRRLAAADRAGILPGSSHRLELREHVRRQAPNSLYYLVSSQIALWLISLLGNAEQVAQAGALGRLAAAFAIVGSVSAVLLQPYFARQQGRTELATAFAWTNAFFALALTTLLWLGFTHPTALLWVLGGHYGGLHDELPWMLCATTFAAWGGTLYSLGTVRGWVQPVGLSVAVGIAAVVFAASQVDVSSVRGAFMINTSIGVAGTALSFGYLALQIRRHPRLEAVPA